MDRISIGGDLCCDAVIIPGQMLDKHLREMNEAQLKIYLYLLRNQNRECVSVSAIADYFNYTVQDVKRSLMFLRKRGTLEIAEADDEDRKSSADEPLSTTKSGRNNTDQKGDNIVTFLAKPSYSKEELSAFAQKPDIMQLLFVAEQYMGKALKSDDIAAILYMYDTFGFEADLIEYIIEYCISNNKRSMRSIEKLAADWAEAGVDTLDKAKERTRCVPKEVYEVFAAFGMDKTRKPVDAEIAYVRKWTESYGFGMDIIEQACTRTILAINKPSFSYAGKILAVWYEAGVHHIDDIRMADEQYRERQSKQSKVPAVPASKAGKKQAKSSGEDIQAAKFKNFKQREYDYDKLEQDALSN